MRSDHILFSRSHFHEFVMRLGWHVMAQIGLMPKAQIFAFNIFVPDPVSEKHCEGKILTDRQRKRESVEWDARSYIY